jgi:hypothetical protein
MAVLPICSSKYGPQRKGVPIPSRRAKQLAVNLPQYVHSEVMIPNQGEDTTFWEDLATDRLEIISY